MKSALVRFPVVAALFPVVVSLMLTGCAGISDRNGAVMLVKEDWSPATISFPTPDILARSQVDVALPVAAEAARQKGLAAARSQDWKAAIAAFKKAQRHAHCAPSLLYNLALAYDRAGQAVPAALWYRAYLAELPNGQNAAAVRAQIARLANQVEARALRQFDEAERLAETLSAEPPSAGAKSQRQAAFERMAWWAYLGGLINRGDALLARATALSGATAVAENIAISRREQGLYGAVFSRDLERARAIQAKLSDDADLNGGSVGGMMARLYAERGDAAQAYDVIRQLSIDELYNNRNIPSLYFAFLDARAYDAAEDRLIRVIDNAAVFTLQLFSWGVKVMEEALWNGRPDVAIRLARRLRAYFDKHDRGKDMWEHRQYHLLVLAVLNDRAALEATMRIGDFAADHYGKEQMLLGRLSLILMLNMPASDVLAFLDDALDRVPLLYHKRSYSAELSESDFPLVYFVRRVAGGQSAEAVNKIAAAFSTKPSDYAVLRALRFAVVSGRSELAISLAKAHPDSQSSLRELNRLARRSGAAEDVRDGAEQYAASVCQGWRPRDPAQAQAVWWRINHANSIYPNEYEYDSMRAKIQEVAREQPEKVPSEIAAYGTVLFMGAMAMRVEH